MDKLQSEVCNQILICSDCNIQFHMKCYGLTTIPSKSWKCQTCSLHIRPHCIFCPKAYGAMKPTECGEYWAHISCALWIPEVSFASVKYMEPIINVFNMIQQRWGLKCMLCDECVGACIQCQRKYCCNTFHVTCAFEHKIPMKAVRKKGRPDDGIKLLSFCSQYCFEEEWIPKSHAYEK